MYLTARTEYQRTPLQERIERNVHGGRLVGGKRNLRRTYTEQFEEGHAAMGGRVIDVASHIPTAGKYKGRMVHFGHPLSARYIWIVDEDGNFIVGNRQTFHHEMPHIKHQKMDYSHRLHKLPHATLARGKNIYGSGEVIVEGGKVKAYNTASGHYIDLKDIRGFNEQGKAVFEEFMKRVGWKAAPGGARYQAKH